MKAPFDQFSQDISIHDCGNMEFTCSHCNAMFWKDEKNSTSTKTELKFSMCCHNDKLKQLLLLKIPEPPDFLRKLFTNNDVKSKYFRKNIRNINCAFSMSSIGVNQQTFSSYGPYVFKICGMIHHRIGQLGHENNTPKFAQIYIYDSEQQQNFRSNLNGLNTEYGNEIIRELQMWLINNNVLVKQFKNAYEISKEKEIAEVSIILRADIRPSDAHTRTYNAPTTNEISIIIPETGNENVFNRDIVLSTREGKLMHIHETHAMYDPLQYVLFHPYGTIGWNLQCRKSNGKVVTALDFYNYRLMVRKNEFNILHYGGRLFQQYVVDQYAKIDQCRLNFLKHNQKKIRADLYCGLKDAIESDDFKNAGKKIILPASHYGGPRFMRKHFQDAMAIVRDKGKPDLFITITCNLNWKEIKNSLLPGQTASDRPDLVTRVFKMKVDELRKDLFSHDVFGKSIAHVMVIEFQKRGLPHAHILIILSQDDKLICVDQIDPVISAEIRIPKFIQHYMN